MKTTHIYLRMHSRLRMLRSALQPVSSEVLAPLSSGKPQRSATAIVYCEGNFGGIDGKIANGLVRHSEKYEILSIIDSEKVGQDAGSILDGIANRIPIVRDLAHALEITQGVPDYFIFGITPATGMLS